MVCCHENELQMFAGFLSIGSLLALQSILHEDPLVSGEALTAAEKVEKSIAVFDEDRSESCRCLGNRQVAGVRGIGARTVHEQDDRCGSRTWGSPDEAFQSKIAARDHNDLRED